MLRQFIDAVHGSPAVTARYDQGAVNPFHGLVYGLDNVFLVFALQFLFVQLAVLEQSFDVRRFYAAHQDVLAGGRRACRFGFCARHAKKVFLQVLHSDKDGFVFIAVHQDGTRLSAAHHGECRLCFGEHDKWFSRVRAEHAKQKQE